MYLGRNAQYKFYSEEIYQCPAPKLDRLARACQTVEADVWNANENFFDYIKKQSAVIYAKYEDEIVGFALFDLYEKDLSLVVAFNECMVVKKHHGSGLPNVFTSLLTTHIQKDYKLRHTKRPYNSITFLSVTVNFKIMEAFRKYSFLSDQSSFRPDSQIIDVANDYIKKENHARLSDQNHFFIKAAYPASVKVESELEPPSYVPKNFIRERGDAFIFISRISHFWFLGLIAWFVLRRYQFKFSKRLIPISRISRNNIIYTRPR